MKDSLILAASARHVLLAALGLSAFVLLRGHNEPGGGFIGGLICALGLVFHALAKGGAATRRALRVPPVALAGAGLLLALAAGLPAMLGSGQPFLTQLWIAGTPLGTALLFDIGVYAVVVGFAAAFLLPFLEDGP